jgi:hypothetical protein
MGPYGVCLRTIRTVKTPLKAKNKPQKKGTLQIPNIDLVDMDCDRVLSSASYAGPSASSSNAEKEIENLTNIVLDLKKTNKTSVNKLIIRLKS